MSVQFKSHLTHRGRDFDATWEGGAYIEVRFAGFRQPTEVINVYDYEKGEIEIPFEQRALQKALKRWVLEQDAEAQDWARENDQPVDDWYAAYVENARYS
jgi:hypothetical protein